MVFLKLNSFKLRMNTVSLMLFLSMYEYSFIIIFSSVHENLVKIKPSVHAGQHDIKLNSPSSVCMKCPERQGEKVWQIYWIHQGGKIQNIEDELIMKDEILEKHVKLILMTRVQTEEQTIITALPTPPFIQKHS